MALQGMESFDFYNGTGVTTGMGLRWLSNGSVDVSVMIAGRNADGQAIELGDTTGVGAFSRRQLIVPDFGPNFTIGFDHNTNTFANQSGGQFFAVAGAAGNNQLALGTDSSARLILYRDGNVWAGSYNGTAIITTAINTLVANTWKHIIIQGTISNTGVANLYVEDSTGVMQLAGTFTGDTMALATADLARLFLAGTGATSNNVRNRFDNLYWANDNTMPILVRRIRTSRPNADGETLGLTPSTGVSHFAMVNETTFDNVDWLTGSTVGLFDDLELTDLPGAAAAVSGVQLVSYAAKSDATARATKLGLENAGVVDYMNNHTLATTPSVLHEIMPTNPATGLPWLFDELNNTRLRAEIAV